MGDLKKLAGQTAIYGIPTIVGRFLNYLLVPVYTYSLTAPLRSGFGAVCIRLFPYDNAHLRHGNGIFSLFARGKGQKNCV